MEYPKMLATLLMPELGFLLPLKHLWLMPKLERWEKWTLVRDTYLSHFSQLKLFFPFFVLFCVSSVISSTLHQGIGHG